MKKTVSIQSEEEWISIFLIRIRHEFAEGKKNVVPIITNCTYCNAYSLPNDHLKYFKYISSNVDHPA